jgi:hypothetical protein
MLHEFEKHDQQAGADPSQDAPLKQTTMAGSGPEQRDPIVSPEIDSAAPHAGYEIALRHLLGGEAHQDLGEIRPIQGVRTTLELGKVASHAVKYPSVVVGALAELFSEYNHQFQPLVEANREFATDYRYAKDSKGQFANAFVQIDMLGLPQQFLVKAAEVDRRIVKDVLRHSIFEIENSLAMYQLLERALTATSGASLFSMQFRRGLDDLRAQHGRPIKLLAVTAEKFEAMRASEFGKAPGEPLSDQEVRELSGFDGLFGPEEFKQHLADHNGRCECLLYVRSSDPPSKLRNPKAQVGSELLDDPRFRKIIKEHSLTFNIDAPHQVREARINDTKGYLHSMEMAFTISRPEDLFSASGVLSPAFADFLARKGIDSEQVSQGEISLRAKPLRGTYGCYGHIRGPLKSKFMRQLREEMSTRGEYAVQPEMETPRVVNASDGQTYTFIDRNFLSYTDGEFRFLGGMRTLMLLDSNEARKGRIHGSKESVYQLVY